MQCVPDSFTIFTNGINDFIYTVGITACTLDGVNGACNLFTLKPMEFNNDLFSSLGMMH